MSWGLECGLAVPGVYADITRPEVQEAGCSEWCSYVTSYTVQARDWVVTTLNSYHPIRSAGAKAASTNTVSAASWG